MNNSKFIFKTIAFILSVSLVLPLSACVKSPASVENPEETSSVTEPVIEEETKVINESGNTQDNYNSGGHLVSQGDDIYFTMRDGIYKTDVSGSEPTLVRSGGGLYDLSLVGDWLYFGDNNDDVKHYRLNTKTGVEELLLEFCTNLRVYKDKLYYSEAFTKKFYKADLDGKNAVVLFENFIYSQINVVDDKLYWVSNDCLYISDLDGKIENFYSTEHSNRVIIDNGYKYTDGNLYKETIDGKDSKLLVKSNVLFINIEGDWIYYISTKSSFDDTDPGIYKIKTDGTEIIQIYRGNATWLSVVGNWVYFTVQKEAQGNKYETKYYRMDINGRGVKELQ